MQASYYLPIIILFMILFILMNNQKAVIARRVLKKRKTEDRRKMVELAKQFIGKECVIYAFDSNHTFEGIVKEVTDSAVLIEKDGKPEAINLDFVIRIREYPRNKNGKKKSFLLD